MTSLRVNEHAAPENQSIYRVARSITYRFCQKRKQKISTYGHSTAHFQVLSRTGETVDAGVLANQENKEIT
jgi:hypothetical protein